MQTLIVTSIIISFSYTIQAASIITDCGPKVEDSDEYVVPTNSSVCTRTPMTDFKSCCYVDFKNNAKPNICVSAESSGKESELQNEYKQTDTNAVVTCSKKSAIPNFCGLVGMIEPIQLTDCSAISIPESHCCLIEVKLTSGTESKVCRRLDEYPNEDSTNTTIITELADYGTIKTITCDSTNISGINAVILIAFLIVFIIV